MAKHLSFEERFIIKTLRQEGKGLAFIAGYINRSKSTIHDELKRNSIKNRIYCPIKADEKAAIRAKKPRVWQKCNERISESWLQSLWRLRGRQSR